MPLSCHFEQDEIGDLPPAVYDLGHRILKKNVMGGTFKLHVALSRSAIVIVLPNGLPLLPEDAIPGRPPLPLL